MTTEYIADGACPYCGKGFHKENVHSVCEALVCSDCGRWFVAKTQTTVTVTAHRIEGEASMPYPLRQYMKVAA